MNRPRPYTPSPEELEHSQKRDFRLPHSYSNLLKAFAILDNTAVSCQIHGALTAATLEWEKGEAGLYAPQPLKYRESSQLFTMRFTEREQQSITDTESLWNTDESALICGAVAGYLHERREDPSLEDAVNRYRQIITHTPSQPD